MCMCQKSKKGVVWQPDRVAGPASLVLLLAIFKQRRELFVPWLLLYGLKIMVEFAFILIYSVVVFQPLDIYYHMWEFMMGSLATAFYLGLKSYFWVTVNELDNRIRDRTCVSLVI